MHIDMKTEAPDDIQAGDKLLAYLDAEIDAARKANAEPIQVVMGGDDYRLFIRHAKRSATVETTTHFEAYRGYPIHIGSITRVRSKRDHTERNRMVSAIMHKVGVVIDIGDRMATELPEGDNDRVQWERFAHDLRIALGEFWQQEAGR